MAFVFTNEHFLSFILSAATTKRALSQAQIRRVRVLKENTF